METDALEQEMNYPNPVERSDLPVKRSRWPRVLAAGLGLLLLIVVFLPQICLRGWGGSSRSATSPG